jgi:hypothetical protein
MDGYMDISRSFLLHTASANPFLCRLNCCCEAKNIVWTISGRLVALTGVDVPCSLAISDSWAWLVGNGESELTALRQQVLVWTWILSLSEHWDPWLFHSCLQLVNFFFFLAKLNVFWKTSIFLGKILQAREGNLTGRNLMLSWTSKYIHTR